MGRRARQADAMWRATFWWLVVLALACYAGMARAAESRGAQSAAIGSPSQVSNSIYGINEAYGNHRVTPDSYGLLNESFDNGIDTTQWTATGTGGTPTVTNSVLSIAPGVTASNWGKYVSVPTFYGQGVGYLEFVASVKLESTPASTTNNDRFWGLATSPATPTFAAPLTNAVGFELSAGVFKCSVWAGGAQSGSSVTITSSLPSDGAYHRYWIVRRAEKAYCYIDTLDVPVATLTNVLSNVFTLPVLLQSANNTSAASPAPTFSAIAVAVGDTTRPGASIDDATYPWRSASVKAASTAAAATDPALVVQLNPIQPNLTTPLNINLSQVGGNAEVTGGVNGSVAVGGVSATNTAITQNPVLIAAEAQTGQPAAATAGRQRQVVSTLDGVQYHRGGGPVSTQFNVAATATTIQVINTNLAGAGLSYYVDDVDLYASALSTTTADQLLELKACTTAGCAGTCTIVLACANIAMGGCSHAYQSPIKLAANTCLCWMDAVAGTKWISVQYHVAP